MTPSIVVVGDLQLDIVADLSAFTLEQISTRSAVQTCFTRTVGGTGAVFALAARRAGFTPVWLIGAVGADAGASSSVADAAGKVILDQLLAAGVKTIVRYDPATSTGTSVIVHLANDRRVLLADKGANCSFAFFADDSKTAGIVENADFLFVSGYSLLEPSQASVVRYLMNLSRTKGNVVVLDLVPHKLFAGLDPTLFAAHSRDVNVLISETNTVRGRVEKDGRPPSNEHTYEYAHQLAKVLLADYAAVLLRPDNDEQYFFDRCGLIEHRQTGYSDASIQDRTGFLDRITAESLYRHQSRIKANL